MFNAIVYHFRLSASSFHSFPTMLITRVVITPQSSAASSGTEASVPIWAISCSPGAIYILHTPLHDSERQLFYTMGISPTFSPWKCTPRDQLIVFKSRSSSCEGNFLPPTSGHTDKRYVFFVIVCTIKSLIANRDYFYDITQPND